MKVRDILNQRTSTLQRARGYAGQSTCTVYNMLYNLHPAYVEKIKKAREILKTRGKDDYREYKINNIPCWFPSGCIAYRDAKDSSMVSHTNILALDIDHLAPEEIEEFRRKFFQEPYVIAVLDSLSGEGLYALILVEDWHFHTEYYKYFEGLLKDKYNVELDPNASNIARKRFISWQPDAGNWIKSDDEEITPWHLKYIETEEPKKSQIDFKSIKFNHDSQSDEKRQIERTRMAIWKLLQSGYNVPGYRQWFGVGCDFAAFEDGTAMFDTLCSNYGKQEKGAVESTWRNCLKNSSIINDDLHRRWQGMAKNMLGERWWEENDEDPEIKDIDNNFFNCFEI